MTTKTDATADTTTSAPKDGAKRYALQDITDAGTGRSFKKGDVVDVEPGELANYEAAGIVGDKA